MQEALAEFLHYLALEKNSSPNTVKSYREDLTQAVDFFRKRLGGDAARPEQLSTRVVRAYLAWLHEQGYAKSTVARRLAAVRSWCRFLCRQGTFKANPADGLRGPRQDRKLPHFVQRDDMLRLLATPPAEEPLGVRDRALLETLYSAGLRVSELTGLDVDDVDLDAGCATVRGKGKRRAPRAAGAARRRRRAALARPASGHRRPPQPRPAGPVPQPRWDAAVVAQRRPAAGKVPRTGGPRPAHESPHAAAQFRHAPARRRRRHPQRPGAARTSQSQHHPDIHARDHPAPPRKLSPGPPGA